jgi:SAM-dependent methyltransferase
LIMLAQKLADIGCPAEITYLDMSEASRAVAEARAAVRGLTSIRFVTGDLLAAAELGPFDYIDCCGVLHHLDDPDAGFRALAAALAPGGGMGLMVYAPYGRNGVYPMQGALQAMLSDDAPRDQVRLARAVLEKLPPTNLLVRNPLVADHKSGDAGLYDLLLHSRDRAYGAGEVLAALDRAGLALASFVEPARYDPMTYLPREPAIRERVERLSDLERVDLAEQLAGNLKTHVFYVFRDEATRLGQPVGDDADVPHIKGIEAAALGNHIGRKGAFSVTVDGLKLPITLPRQAGRLIGLVDGRRSLGDIRQVTGVAGPEFQRLWGQIDARLTGFNLLHYSQGARR